MKTDVTAYDENTLRKVYAALDGYGLTDEQKTDCVNAMQNEGILFRERADEKGDASDGDHTFTELYEHRMALTAALAAERSDIAWRTKQHHPEDDPMFEGYFMVGLDLPTGTITYHYELKFWDDFSSVPEAEYAPKWDGAAPALRVDRLLEWAR